MTAVDKLVVLVIVVVSATWFFLLGMWFEHKRSNQLKEPAVATNEDWLVHPETTKYEKWQKMTPRTRDALLGLYIENQEACMKHITETNGVTIGESAILFLFERYQELLEIKKAKKDAVDRRARNILGIDDPPTKGE